MVSHLHSLLVPLFVVSLLSISQAEDCSSWNSYSPTYLEWCRVTGCPYCSGKTGADFDSCFEYFKPYCYVEGSAPTSTPEDCSNWNSYSPSYLEWCRVTGCPYCSGKTGADFDSCFEYFKPYCYVEGSAPTSIPPGSDSGPTVCTSWTGIASVYDDYCQNQACPACNAYTDETIRQSCYKSQASHCHIPDSSDPKPSDVPTKAPTPTTFPKPSLVPTQAPVTTTRSTSSSASNAVSDGATFTKRVIYLDWTINEGANGLEESIRTSVDNGFNIVVLAFWIHKHDSGKMNSYWDAAEKWINLPSSTRQSILTYVHSKGAKLTLSVGGATEHHPALMNGGVTGSEYGKMCAEKVIEAELDGLDFDSEGWSSQDFMGKKGTNWLIDATVAAYEVLSGSGKIISHAPQGPYFSVAWSGEGGYGEIDRQVGHMIDYYFVQFYNQGSSYPYNSYQTLFVSGQGSAINEIIAQGVPQDKIVTGKYVTSRGSNGYTSPSTLKSILCEGYTKDEYTAGGGIWMYDVNNLEETKQFGQLLSSKC